MGDVPPPSPSEVKISRNCVNSTLVNCAASNKCRVEILKLLVQLCKKRKQTVNWKWIQGLEKKDLFQKSPFLIKWLLMSHPFSFLFKNIRDMIEGWMKDVQRRNRNRTKNIEISKWFHLISYKYFKILLNLIKINY